MQIKPLHAWALMSLALAAPAYAHLPFDMQSGSHTLATATALPNAHTSWHVFGALMQPGQVDFLKLQLSNGQAIDVLPEVFDQPAAAQFAPTLALIGPGLDAPTVSLPFTLPAGNGALVDAPSGDPTSRPIDADGPYIWLAGQPLTTTAPQDGTYYLAIWATPGRIGEYTLNWASDDIPDEQVPNHPELQGFTDITPGDVNGDGKVDVGDVTLALQFAIGLTTPTPRQLRSADVAPPRPDNAHFYGDGRITVADAVRLLQFVIGVIPADQFP